MKTLNKKIYTVQLVKHDNLCVNNQIIDCSLEPMTHKEACTFKGKMMEPSNHIIVKIMDIKRYIKKHNDQWFNLYGHYKYSI